LVDYDFGGIEGQVEYPPGYVKALPDGGRGSANEGEMTTSEWDTEALHYVLGVLHFLEASAPPLPKIDWNNMGLVIQSLDEVESLLSGMENWKLELSVDFRKFLAEHDKIKRSQEKKTQDGDAVTPHKAVVVPPTKRVRED
jgi:hypothetical protein